MAYLYELCQKEKGNNCTTHLCLKKIHVKEGFSENHFFESNIPLGRGGHGRI